MSEVFRNVLQVGKGQCRDCCERVITVLTQNPTGSRHWHAADYGFNGYVKHKCGMGVPLGPRKPPKRAA